jgi:hypothetical protein
MITFITVYVVCALVQILLAFLQFFKLESGKAEYNYDPEKKSFITNGIFGLKYTPTQILDYILIAPIFIFYILVGFIYYLVLPIKLDNDEKQ